METEVAVIQDTGFWLHLQNGNSAKKKKKGLRSWCFGSEFQTHGGCRMISVSGRDFNVMCLYKCCLFL